MVKKNLYWVSDNFGELDWFVYAMNKPEAIKKFTELGEMTEEKENFNFIAELILKEIEVGKNKIFPTKEDLIELGMKDHSDFYPDKKTSLSYNGTAYTLGYHEKLEELFKAFSISDN